MNISIDWSNIDDETQTIDQAPHSVYRFIPHPRSHVSKPLLFYDLSFKKNEEKPGNA